MFFITRLVVVQIEVAFPREDNKSGHRETMGEGAGAGGGGGVYSKGDIYSISSMGVVV